VKRTYPKILRNRKARIERRLAPRHWSAQPEPMLRGGNVRYEMAERTGRWAVRNGVMHTLVQQLGLAARSISTWSCSRCICPITRAITC